MAHNYLNELLKKVTQTVNSSGYLVIILLWFLLVLFLSEMSNFALLCKLLHDPCNDVIIVQKC